MTQLAKLDMYKYQIFPNMIQIELNRTSDPILGDIMSDIHNSHNKIYVEGQHFWYQSYEIVKLNGTVYLQLHVINKSA